MATKVNVYGLTKALKNKSVNKIKQLEKAQRAKKKVTAKPKSKVKAKKSPQPSSYAPRKGKKTTSYGRAFNPYKK